jgi:Flp pilus assembly protein TadD
MDEPQIAFDAGPFAALQKAEHFNQIGRHDLAERELRSALGRYPQEPELHVQLGWALDGQGRALEAEAEGMSALQVDPEAVGAMALLAKLAMDQGKHQQAEQHCLDALRLEPEHPYLYLIYGSLMQKTGHLEKAEKLMRRCLELDPENSHAHGALSVILAERKQAAPATMHGQLGVYVDPDSDHSHAMLGHTYLVTGRPFKARAHLREALRLDPSPHAEEMFLAADRATRWTYLPMYFWSLWLDRIPGKQFAVWGAFIVLSQGMRSSGAPDGLRLGILGTYFLFCVYTWIAGPLTTAWIKMRPPR